LLLVSLFLDWYDDVLNAWEAFEALDLFLAAIAVGLLAAAVGLLTPEVVVVDRRWIPWLTLAALAMVTASLLDSPPAVPGDEIEVGAWLALAACLVLGLGALLTFGRVSFAVSFDSRDPRRRVDVVDAADPARAPVVTPPTEPTAPIGRTPGGPASP
jgi:hypothetical protein